MTVPFPITLPANTVYGRLGVSAGPGEAIPFATLKVQLAIGLPINVSDFGAVGDGIADDTVPLQNAINQAIALGRNLYIGNGHFRITSQLNVNGDVQIIGAGWGNTSIELGSSTINGFVISSESGSSITGLQMVAANNGTISQATAGSLITITGPAGGLPNQIFFLRDLRLVFGFFSITFISAQVWTIDNCYILGAPLTGTGILIQNTEFPGSGEFSICNTLIQGGDAVTTWGGSGIFHASGVNLKIVNSEIFGWVNGYNLTLGSATAMAGTFICNSVFSQVEQGITLNKGTGTTYNVVHIDNCEFFARNPISMDTNTGWLLDLTVSNCSIGAGQGSPVSASTGTGISLSACNTFSIIGNLFTGAAGNNSVVIGVNSSNGFISGNLLRGALAAVSNSSTSTVVLEFASNALKFSGATSGFQFGNLATPVSDGGSALGAGTAGWSNLFIVSGGTLNFGNSNYIVTHSSGLLTFNGGFKSSNAATGVGYATGAGGTVTQITSRTTAVTLNKITGSIQTDTTSLAAEAAAEFTVNNTSVVATDTVVVSIKSGSNGGNTAVNVTGVAANSFNIKVSNNNAAAGTAETGAIVINFAVMKAVTA